ncbi:hypothetical protein Skr01_25470 [Sphaerisporangium krabiense]|nr:hypothetical protein Skr01_25470 [Sphaerisporangium krabiense]
MDVRLGGLAGEGLGHEGFAGARWAPQQQRPRHVAAPRLERRGVPEQNDVVPEPIDDVVLSLDVGEPRSDLPWAVGVDSRAQEAPEEPAGGDPDQEDTEGELRRVREELAEQIR